MADVDWSFYGYVTPGGNQDVQDWFDGLDDDAKDAIRDAIGYLQKAPLSLWRKPDFEHLDDGLSEIRVKDNLNKKIYRIYGVFHPKGQRYAYTFLLGHNKKVTNPRRVITDARKRKSKMERAEATIHEFEFTKESD